MCNIYSLSKPRHEVAKVFGVGDNRADVFEPLFGIYPGNRAPVVRLAADGVRELRIMSWGFVLPQPGKAAKRVTNVRDDKLLVSPFWRAAFPARRCLVPATSYCEPNGETPASWYWFALKRQLDARPLFAFPGIWQTFEGSLKKDGPKVQMDVFAFLTTEPNALTASINHERMPVLVAGEDQFERWLSGSVAEALSCIGRYPPEFMTIVQSGADKQDSAARAA